MPDDRGTHRVTASSARGTRGINSPYISPAEYRDVARVGRQGGFMPAASVPHHRRQREVRAGADDPDVVRGRGLDPIRREVAGAGHVLPLPPCAIPVHDIEAGPVSAYSPRVLRS